MSISAAESLPVTVYTPEAALRRPGIMFRGMWADLRASGGLAMRLATRDLRAQYRQSLLGYLWAFITPLANTAAWIFLNASGVVKVADTGIPYPVYVFTGTMLWQVFVQALQSPLQQISGARPMLAKLNFPRESILLSGMIKQLAASGVKLVILLPVILILGVMPDWHLALFIFALFALMIAGFSVGLIIAPIGMLYTDIGRAIPLATQFAMYITPVVFAMPKEGVMVKVFEYNFVTPLILTARAWLTGMESPMLAYFIWVSVASCLLLLLGWLIFRITMPVIIERVS